MVDRHRKKPFNDSPKKTHPFQPQRSGTAHQPKSQINLITNNFKIKSKNHGVIYTYRVDFIEDRVSVKARRGRER